MFWLIVYSTEFALLNDCLQIVEAIDMPKKTFPEIYL